MKLLLLLLAFGVSTLPLTLPATAIAAEAQEKAAPTSAEKQKDTNKSTTVLVLDAKPAAVHAAALEALAGIGCEIKKDTLENIEGKRPHKVGLAVGSGGEKLFVSIKILGEGKTEVKVVTKKSMLGIVGQKRWNDEVASHIRDAVK